MTISAKVIADSISTSDKRITTLELYYPRFVHAEFMTHRVFSRNASSSRAIPVEKMIQSIIDDTAMPIHWGANQKGMQAREECKEPVYGFNFDSFDNSDDGVSREVAWLWARDKAIKAARAFAQAGYHKQIVNRLLEPFAHIRVVVTATEWDNFFALRLHPDAQPEIHELARCMKEAMDGSTPELLHPGLWHLPYITPEEKGVMSLYEMPKISVARCARVSYRLHDGSPTPRDKDLDLYGQLIRSVPAHASPAEHQAIAMNRRDAVSNNFRGWYQHREMLGV